MGRDDAIVSVKHEVAEERTLRSWKGGGYPNTFNHNSGTPSLVPVSHMATPRTIDWISMNLDRPFVAKHWRPNRASSTSLIWQRRPIGKTSFVQRSLTTRQLLQSRWAIRRRAWSVSALLGKHGMVSMMPHRRDACCRCQSTDVCPADPAKIMVESRMLWKPRVKEST